MSAVRLDQVEKVLDRLQRPRITIHHWHCARKRHRASTCTRCLDACPTGAITWDDGLQIDPERCTSCGVCAAVCPTGALEAQAPSSVELLAQVIEGVKASGRVAFACPLILDDCRDSEPYLAVSCLGRLDESILVGAVAYGAESVWLLDRACGDCAQAACRQVAAEAVERSNRLLEFFGLEPRITFRPDLPLAQDQPAGPAHPAQGVSRRGLFKLLARETTHLGGPAGAPEDGAESSECEQIPRGELPKELPDRRALLLAALQRLGRPVQPSPAAEDTGLFAAFGVSDQCTGCQMCAFFCPTEGLTKVERNGKAGVAFRPAHCVNCGLCRDICYRDAVVLSELADLNPVIDDVAELVLMRDTGTAPWRRPAANWLAGMGDIRR